MKIFLWLGLFFLFFLPPTDPDLGWQLRCGQQIWEQGKICTTNEFSVLLAGYLTSYPAGYQFLIYPFYKFFNLFGLSLLGALMMFLSLYLFLNLSGNKTLRLMILPLIIFLSWSVFGFGLRSQLLGIFYFALLLFLIDSPKKNWLWFSPLVILAWVNSHGSFILGLVLLAFFLAQQTFSILTKKMSLKQYFSFCLIFVFSFIASFLNPFTFRIYLEAWRHFHVVQLNQLIAEWVPPTLFPQIMIVLFLGLALYSLCKFRQQKLWLLKILLLTAFAFLAFQARRNIAFFFLSAGWIISSMDLKKSLKYLTPLPIIAIFVFGFFFQLPKTLIIDSNWQRFCQSGSVRFTCEAVEFLKKQPAGPPNGEASNIFNTYEQGGFLIWQLPEYKIFVDGRMPAWSTPSGKSPYTIYLDTLQTQPGWQETLKQYHINWLLIAPNTFMDLRIRNNPQAFGWLEVYRDPAAVIYKKQ